MRKVHKSRLKRMLMVLPITAKRPNAKTVSQCRRERMRRGRRQRKCKLTGARKKAKTLPEKKRHNIFLEAPSMGFFIQKKPAQREERCIDVNAHKRSTSIENTAGRSSAGEDPDNTTRTDVELLLILTNILYSDSCER